MDTRGKLSTTTIALHWLIAIAIIGMIVMGEVVGDMPRGATKSQLMGLHFSIGVLILLVAALRVVWRGVNGFPEPTRQPAPWERLLATVSHWALIIGTLAMPLSGALAVMSRGRGIDMFGLVQIPALIARNDDLHHLAERLHGAGAKILILFIILHVAGALKHQLVDRDSTMSRMLGRRVDVA